MITHVGVSELFRNYTSNPPYCFRPCKAFSIIITISIIIIIIIIIIITLWSRVLPENVPGPQLSKEFPASYRTPKFITAFKRARHLSISRARSIHFIAPSHFLKIYFKIIVTFRPRSPKWSPSRRSLYKNSVCTSPVSHTCYMSHPSHSFDHPNNI
jgi:hypothetical protein